MKENRKVSIIGAALLDVLAGPLDFDKVQAGTMPMKQIRQSYGGDALNQAVILARLNKEPELISLLGKDQPGAQILSFLENEGIRTDHIRVDPALSTSINIVLVDEKAERYFLTDPDSSLRKLDEKTILSWLQQNPDSLLISFASLFVSPLLDIPALCRVFEKIREDPRRILAADMTKAKKGESLQDIKPLLGFIDYLFGNEEEMALLCNNQDVFSNARALFEAGARHVIVKRGAKGCLIYDVKEFLQIPAFEEVQAKDSTGAGDAFAAGFLYGLLERMNLEECGCFASAAASLVIEKYGATDGFCQSELVWQRFEALKNSISKN